MGTYLVRSGEVNLTKVSFHGVKIFGELAEYAQLDADLEVLQNMTTKNVFECYSAILACERQNHFRFVLPRIEKFLEQANVDHDNPYVEKLRELLHDDDDDDDDISDLIE